MLENHVPPNVFEVTNLANGDGYTFIGKSSLVDNNSGNKTITAGNNCLSTFLIGSIIPGRNIRLDIPTETDPNIFLDAKFFDFQAYTPLVSGSCTLGRTADTSGDLSYYFRTIINDGSSAVQSWIIIEADDASFYVGYDGVTYYKKDDGTYSISSIAVNPNSLILKTHKLDIVNSHPFMPSLYTHKNIDEYGNTTFYLNKIIAGPGMVFTDFGDTVKLDYDYTKARQTPCCNSDYSGIDNYDPVSQSSVNINVPTCSDTAIVYLVGYDFKQRAELDTITCEGGFCNWSLDAYTFATSSTSLSGGFLTPNIPYYIRSGWYYRLKAEQTVDGYFMWNMRVMKYKTYYMDCLDDESSDYYRDFDRDFDQQERKVVRQDTELLVLTHSTSGAFDLFTRNIPLQPNGKFLYNEELTIDWVEATAPPIYAATDPNRIQYNVNELFLDGPHYNNNINTFADVTKAWTACGPYTESSSSSLSDSETMGPLYSTSSNSSNSISSNSLSSNSSNSSSSSSNSSSSSSESSSSSSISSYSGSESSMSSQS
jgi:hypothetical protein